MTDYSVDQKVEGWSLSLGDQIVVTDYDDEIHHIEVDDLQDETTAFRGNGYCHDHDQDCYFIVGAFEEVRLWTFI